VLQCCCSVGVVCCSAKPFSLVCYDTYVALCCTVLYCVAECCSVLLQCVAMCCNVLQCVAIRRNMLQVLQCVAMCRSVLQRVAVSRIENRESRQKIHMHTQLYTHIHTHTHTFTHTHTRTHTHINTHTHTHTNKHIYTHTGFFKNTTGNERWGAGVETQKNVRGEIGGWSRVPFNETYAPSLSTIYDGA